MHAKRIISALVLAAVVGALAWALTLLNPNAATAPLTHVLSGTATSTGFEYTEDHPYYTVDVVYPNTGNQAEQTAIETVLQSTLNDYAQAVEDLDPSLMPSLGEGYKLALDISYQRFTGAGNTTSYLFTIYEDTGGAHPNGTYETFVFDEQGSMLALSALFVPPAATSTPEYLAHIASLASAQVQDELGQRVGGDAAGALFAEGLTPTPENYQNFVIDGDMLRFFFPPYQVAAYAAGTFEADIPLSALSAFLAPGLQ